MRPWGIVRRSTPLLAAVLSTLIGPSGAEAARARVMGHACTAQDTVMQCVFAPMSRPAGVSSAAAVGGYGVDFAWSCPLNKARDFGASYLSPDPTKNWTRSCVKRFHAAGKGTVAVWEAGGCDATNGYNRGYSDAKQAAREISGLGAPRAQPFTLAVDCNVAGSRLVPYFRGADAAEPGRINAFGGYYTILYLYKRHLVGQLNWQTYGWSQGHWLPASVAPLEQYNNMSTMDDDRAIAVNYGQWPAQTMSEF